ncbi:MAG: beta-lactamase family protein [Acetobacteraceae bacterium]|nr:beta-lactamase family protein [Acetobacteraceae bacterium]
MRTLLLVLAWIGAVALPIPACAQRPAETVAASDPLPRAAPEQAGMSSERLQRIGAALQGEIEAGKMPGAVVAIARRGNLVYFEAFGYRDKQANAPMTTDTIFNIASMTKPMTAVGALMLEEQGRLLIGESLFKYLPQFADMQVADLDQSGATITGKLPAARPITLRDLLIHTSGLIYGGRGSTALHKMYPWGSATAAMSMTGQEFLTKLSGLPLLHQPGTVWDYGFGLDVLGLVIESVTKQRLSEYLEERLFAPLGMTDTGFAIPAGKADRYAKALPADPETGQPQSVDPDLTRAIKFDCGGGCAVSTAGDYMRFALMLLNRGELAEHRILAPKTVDTMLANQLGPDVRNLIGNADPTRAGYGFGLGLAVRTSAGLPVLEGSVGDFSWPGASGTNWWVDPHEQLVVVFMAHTPGPARWHYRFLINTLVYQAILN